jgi:hypothetical protein
MDGRIEIHVGASWHVVTREHHVVVRITRNLKHRIAYGAIQKHYIKLYQSLPKN